MATARKASEASFEPSPNLVLVDGDIGKEATAKAVTETAISRFGSIDHVVANAGIFISKPFVDYTPEDFQALVSTNIEGFLYVTQLAVKQMLSQGKGGSVRGITAHMVDSPNASIQASVAMITKGGLTAALLSLASEYAKQHLRFNAVAPGVVDTPMHTNKPKDFLKTLSPMATISSPQDIEDAVVYLTEAKKRHRRSPAGRRRLSRRKVVIPHNSEILSAQSCM